MAKENKQLIKTWEYRYQDYLNSGLSIHKTNYMESRDHMKKNFNHNLLTIPTNN